MKKGIDVSRYQLAINWEKVKNEIDFAIIRCGYGKVDNQKDRFFELNYSECKRLNIPVGVYHYTYATSVSEAIQEAKLVIKWLNNKDLDLPVYFDIEDAKLEKLGKNVLTEICIAFCREIEKAGYWAGIYANKYWLTNVLDTAKLEKLFTIWVAQYNVECTYKGKFDIWQNSSSGKVDGIKGYVDTNIMYRDLIAEIKNTKTKKLKSDEEIIQEILRGDWGNGNERKEKLQNAGYEYNRIQQKINENYGQNSIRKTNEEIAKEVIKGLWGNGQERIDKLTQNGYNATEIQKIVNTLI